MIVAKLRGIATDLDTIANSDDPASYIETLADLAADLRAVATELEVQTDG